MEKRVFIAILLSFVVLAAYQAVFPPAPVPPASVGAPLGPAPNQSAGTAAPSPTAPLAPASAVASAAVPLVADTMARDIVVETDTVRAVFSTAGATLRSWKLKHYLDEGQPLELLPADLPTTFKRPFDLTTADPAESAVLASAFFRPSADGLTLGDKPGQLTFEYTDASGLHARKTFYFQSDAKPYVLKVEAVVDLNGTTRPVTLHSGALLNRGYAADGSQYLPVRGLQHLAGDVEYLAASTIQDQPKYEGTFLFFGAEDQYFLHAALPGTERMSIEYDAQTLPVPGSTAGETRGFVGYQVVAPGPLALPFFIGPKDFDILAAVRRELVLAIDFGMFRVVVVPLLIALKWVNGFVGNYGWSIVVLTIIINVLIFPLRHRSMVSMRRMQAVQPEVKAIQERYAKYKVTDPERQKMNQEMMALYKQKGVNPASGCVPMLLTLPVLFAFYAMLSAAIELRDAPFFGWITDLSRRDPLYITPILMGLSMLWQQRMMPTTADPIQQRIFLLMPVIFTVSFLWAPSGLVVYWFTSNMLAIGQQYLTNRMIDAPRGRQLAVPARVKPSGSGRSKK
jgi:YidC/Oxa1 family membrane protein insertase